MFLRNLNTALWAYYEYDAPLDALQNAPQMKFLCDITIGEGESVAPNTKFVKTWRIKNIGTFSLIITNKLKFIINLIHLRKQTMAVRLST